jgi:hypothetical protein
MKIIYAGVMMEVQELAPTSYTDTQPLDFRGLDSQPHYALCPSCQEWTEFTFLGVQRWPEAVARLHGLPSTLMLYNCACCQTTISQPAPEVVAEVAA